MKEFFEQIKELSDVAIKKNLEAQNAVAEVSKLMQTKYPELTAEYFISDGGIIFIDDSDGWEFYNIARQFNINQNLVAKLFMATMQTILDKVEK